MKIKLFRIILQVKDIEKATSFYQKVLNINGERVSPGRHYFNLGGTILACFDPVADGDNFQAKPNPDFIYFAVKDLQDVYNRLEGTDCIELGQIESQPWGERSFYAKDPFDNPICFVDEETVFTSNN